MSVVKDAWQTIVPPPHDRHGPLGPMLLTLTVVTGAVDAFSYLVLGHVFVANMTGNVVFLAFALAGAHGFSVPASLLALAAFVVGAGLGGRIDTRYSTHRGRQLTATAVFETVLVAAGVVVLGTSAAPNSNATHYVLIVLLAIGMGAQNATARRLAVPDLTTTVLTLTLTGVSADSRLSGGPDSKAGRRGLSVVSMFLGALSGSLLLMHVSHISTLVLALGLLVVVVAAATVASRGDDLWIAPAAH
jgi:uncharacterized membrane protein YoaK (UPF0700 family)